MNTNLMDRLNEVKNAVSYKKRMIISNNEYNTKDKKIDIIRQNTCNLTSDTDNIITSEIIVDVPIEINICDSNIKEIDKNINNKKIVIMTDRLQNKCRFKNGDDHYVVLKMNNKEMIIKYDTSMKVSYGTINMIRNI